MAPKLTEEQRSALTEQAGPIHITDELSGKVYVLVDQDLHERAMRALDLEEIQRGIEQIEAGLGRPFEEIDAEIREKYGFGPPE